MTGTDYTAIVNELNKCTSPTVRPKGQPNDSHKMYYNQVRLKRRTGNGDDAHQYPCGKLANSYDSIADKERDKILRRTRVIAKRNAEKKEAEALKKTEEMKKSLSEIFG